MNNQQVEVSMEGEKPIDGNESIKNEKSDKRFRLAPIWIISLFAHSVVLALLAYWVVESAKKKDDVIITTQILEVVEEPLDEKKEVAVVKENQEVKNEIFIYLQVSHTNCVVITYQHGRVQERLCMRRFKRKPGRLGMRRIQRKFRKRIDNKYTS